MKKFIDEANKSMEHANQFALDQIDGFITDMTLLESKYGEDASKFATILSAAMLISFLLAHAKSEQEKKLTINAILEIAKEKADLTKMVTLTMVDAKDLQ